MGGRLAVLAVVVAMLAPSGSMARPALPAVIGDLVAPAICSRTIDDLIAPGPSDPGALGPHDVTFAEYGEDDDAAFDHEHPIEERGRVAYPDDLECGPYPIVFVMHGRHATCYHPDNGSASQNWPCSDGKVQLPSYRGFDYLLATLASHGIIAVSISANGLNAAPLSLADPLAGELFQRHMEIWDGFNGAGGAPFGALFSGRVDLDRVGTLGHSRGGQGAMTNWNVNASQGAPFGIKGILAIGATFGQSAPIPHDVPVGVVLPYCDGDQDSFGSLQYYDRARYAQIGDTAPKHTFEVIGANHDNYNTYWDPDVFTPASKDDWPNDFGGAEPFCELNTPESGRLGGGQQRATLRALASAFFQRYLEEDLATRPFLVGDAVPPPSAQTDQIYVSYHPPDLSHERRDINRFSAATELATSTIGGQVIASGLHRFEWCDGLSGPQGCMENFDATPFTGKSGRAPHVWSDLHGQARIAWTTASAELTHRIPPQMDDVDEFGVVQFRVYVDFTDRLNARGSPQDFSVELEDNSGDTVATTVGLHSRSLFYPPSSVAPLASATAIPRAVFNTVRIPLTAFEGVDLSNVRRVRFRFDQVATGAVNIADLAFAN